MNDDPRKTFQADQDAAADEMATRDAQNWENHLETHHHNVYHAIAMTHRTQAQANLWNAIARLIQVAAFLGAVWFVLYMVGAWS